MNAAWTTTLGLLLVVAAGITGCGNGSGTGGSHDADLVGTWRVVSVDGVKLAGPATDKDRIEFRADGTWSATDPCNAYRGIFDVQAGSFSGGPEPGVLHAGVGCNNLDYYTELQRGRRIRVSASRATIVDGAGDGVLELERQHG